MELFFLLAGAMVVIAGFALGARSKRGLKPAVGLRDRIEPAALALGLKLVRHDAGVCEFRGTNQGVETVIVAYAGVTNISAYPATALPVAESFRVERHSDKVRASNTGDGVFDGQVTISSEGGAYINALLDAETRQLLIDTVGSQGDATDTRVFFRATRERVFAIGGTETPERVLEMADQARRVASALGDAASSLEQRLVKVALTDPNAAVAARAVIALAEHAPETAQSELPQLQLSAHPLVRLAAAVVAGDVSAAGRAFASTQSDWADVSDLLARLPLNEAAGDDPVQAFGAAIHSSDERLSTLLAVAPRRPAWLPVWEVARDLVTDGSVAARLGWSSWPEAVGQTPGGTALVAGWLGQANGHELSSYIALLAEVGGRDEVEALHAESKRGDRTKQTRAAALSAVATIQERLGDAGFGGLAVVEPRDGQLSVAEDAEAGQLSDAAEVAEAEVTAG